MQLLIKGKNIEVNDTIRAHVEKKLSRLDRYLDFISQAEVEVSREKTKAATDRYVVEVTMRANGTILRGEEKAADLYSAVDSVVDVMQRRLTRFKEKLQQRGRNAMAKEALAEEQASAAPAEVSAEGEPVTVEPRVARTKLVSIKPMSESEAAEQMELLGHDFFLFYNSSTDRIGVLYRRHDGNYGLIEGELGA